MRICPVGLIHPGDPESAVRDAAAACRPSHFTDVAVQGRCLGRTWYGASVPRKIDLAVELVRDADPAGLLTRIQDLYDLVGSTLAAADAVPSAFGILFLAQGDPLLCGRYGAALSGDADTVAAIACAVAGAWKGAKAFPDPVVAELCRANPELDFEGMADGLARLAERSLEEAPE
jgi:ADP-ribosylglycohydrolase